MNVSAVLGSRGFIFWLQVSYLVVLGLLLFDNPTLERFWKFPKTIGSLPIGVLWFGSLGAVLISMTGVFEHAHDWDTSFIYWHWARPVVGASFGGVAVLFVQAGVLAIGSNNTANSGTNDVVYYIIAFIVGYREETFRELIKKVTDVIFTPAPPAVSLTVTGMTPAVGPQAGGTVVTITGTAFTGVTSVKFGPSSAIPVVDSDSLLKVTTPRNAVAETVSVVVIGKGGTAVAGNFTYQ